MENINFISNSITFTDSMKLHTKKYFDKLFKFRLNKDDEQHFTVSVVKDGDELKIKILAKTGQSEFVVVEKGNDYYRMVFEGSKKIKKAMIDSKNEKVFGKRYHRGVYETISANNCE